MAATTTRRRRARTDGVQTVGDVKKLVDELIKENRALKRKVAKLEAEGATVQIKPAG